jgi:hypothetical protein
MRYVNGLPTPIGYLSTLRLLSAHRNRGILARGYAFLHQLHSDGRTPFYLTTIAAGNDTALRTLTSSRAGLPTYRSIGDYHTLAIPIPRRRRRTPRLEYGDFTVRPAEPGDLPAIFSLFAEEGPKRQFFPCYEHQDFFTENGTFRDLQPEDLLLAFRNGRLVGMLGAWDQRRFRQSVVQRYNLPLRWLQPLYNPWARLRGIPQLPRVGQPIPYRLAVLPLVADNDERIFAGLLDHVWQRLAWDNDLGSRPPIDFLLLGLHAADPLLPIVWRGSSESYTTHLFVVCWEDGESQAALLDSRVPYLELGLL